MLYLVLYIAACFINFSVGNHVYYYVIPTTGNQTCPTAGQVCHHISYYTNFKFHSKSKITFIFLEGQHILIGTLRIDGPNSVTLKGQGQIAQSNVIYCMDNGQIEILHHSTVYMERLTYINGKLILGLNQFLQHAHICFMILQNATLSVFTRNMQITNIILDNTNCTKCYQGLWLHLLTGQTHNHHIIHNVTIKGVSRHIASSDLAYGIPYYNGALALKCNSYGKYSSSVNLTDATITNNNVSGISILRCRVKIGNATISNNHSPFNGGGIWNNEGDISSLPNTAVSFINNTAKGVGGAIYMDPSQGTGSNIKPIFKNNSAVRGGDNVYGGKFSFAKGFPFTLSQMINCSQSYKYPWPKPLSSYVTSDPIAVCICNGSVDCTIRSLYKQIYPGQLIALSLVIVGQCGGISPGVLLTEGNGVDISLLTNDQQTLKTCKNFPYQFKHSNTTTSNERNVVLSYNNKMYQFEESPLLINISFLSCPHGLQTGQISGVCECNDVVNSIVDTQCNIFLIPHPISRSGNNWLYYSHRYNCTVAYKHCPFDYCITSNVSLNLNESDLQCTYNRSGILCGQCQPGLSLMLGSNQCGHCSNYYLFLLPVFIIAGIGLIFTLLTLNLTVSVGTINGLLFYANILKLNEPVLFPDTNIPVLTQFISWLNLDFGFNVCFFNGLDGYWKTWLQFTFSLTLILFIIVCCRYSGKLSRLFGKNVVSGLSTLILMAHSKLLLTIRNSLMISPIKCKNFYWNVWSVDGNINYLSSKHIPLFVVSLLFLLTGLIYTLVIFCSQWIQQYSGKYCSSRFDPYVRLKPFIDSYTGPYKDKYQFWTGLLLIIRLIMTAVFAYTTGSLPQVNNYITMFVCLILLTFMRGKYIDRKNTILEFFFLFNLGVTSVLNAFSDHVGFNIKIYINGVSIGISLVVFTVIVIYHVHVLVRKKYTCIKQNNRYQQDQEPLLQEFANEEEMNSPAHVINRREPLIFDFVPTH